ncbi:hypothetical protein EK904_001225 [Melospiza melodia maxima]|nr:hypothetical protein EK904_001225 [Melospiza melodia maxima]
MKDQCQQKGGNGKEKGKQQGERGKLSKGSPKLGEAGERKAKYKIKPWNPLIICIMWSRLSQLSLMSCWWVPLDKDCIISVSQCGLLYSGKD